MIYLAFEHKKEDAFAPFSAMPNFLRTPHKFIMTDASMGIIIGQA